MLPEDPSPVSSIIVVIQTARWKNGWWPINVCKQITDKGRMVEGKPRMALFAGDLGIEVGEELTYDYNFKYVKPTQNSSTQMANR